MIVENGAVTAWGMDLELLVPLGMPSSEGVRDSLSLTCPVDHLLGGLGVIPFQSRQDGIGGVVGGDGGTMSTLMLIRPMRISRGNLGGQQFPNPLAPTTLAVEADLGRRYRYQRLLLDGHRRPLHGEGGGKVQSEPYPFWPAAFTRPTVRR